MTRSQAVAAGILVAQAIVAYLLTQPDVTIPPLVKVVLGASAVGLNALALVLRIQPPPPSVAVPGGDQPVGGG